MVPGEDELRRIKEQFAILDQNGSGRIERDEFEELLSFLGLDPKAEQMKTLWAVLDTDEDGLISFQEFLDFVFSTGDVSFFTPSELELAREFSQKRLASRNNETLASEDVTGDEVGRLQKRVEELEAEARKREKVLAQVQAKLQAAREDQLLCWNDRSTPAESTQADGAGASVELAEEIVQLKKQLNAKQISLQRLESQQEKVIEGYVGFVHSLMESSASEQLQSFCDLSTAEMLGKGAYGFVLTCQDKDHQQPVVVKLQSPRWAAVAAQEWAHGSACAHKHIVSHLQVLLHHDSRSVIERKIAKAYDDDIFRGKRPRIFPDRYICMIMEYMDGGTVQHLSSQGLVDLQGLAAIVRQVSSALAFLHKGKQTHNDIKPENILVKKATDGDYFIVKLADFGLAQWSVERQRDAELAAYSFWCLGLDEPFEHLPLKPDRPAAVERFTSYAIPKDSRQDLRDTLAKVIQELWSGCTEMAVVAALEAFQEMQLKVHHARHQEIEIHAKQEIPPRLERQAKLWKAVHMVNIVKRWSLPDELEDAY